MQIINYPFENVNLNANTKILIDTCFLFSLLYDKDPKNTECIMTLKKLIIAKCKLFTNDIVTAEFINQMQKKMFIDDMKHRATKRKPVNTQPNINLILACFSKSHRKIIKEKKLEKFHHIPFNKYFHNIAKNEWKRDLLKIYYERSVEMHNQLEKSLRLIYTPIDKNSVILAKEFMKTYMMSVNDAYHLASAELSYVNFLLTLDCDFEEIKQCSVNILKI